MAQDDPQSARVQRMAEALRPHFDQTRIALTRQIAQAEDGRLIEQTQMLIV